jgi:YegS/Rv2252/BmrU family lipid kinase
MRIALICNPVSGRGRSRRLESRLVRALEHEGHNVMFHCTRGPGDATDWTRDNGDAADRIVVLGGDGTLNEVLNGLEDPSKIPLSQLATGTANLLAHDLGLPGTPEAFARMVGDGIVLRLDMGLIGERRFLLVVSAGFDAMVVREIARTRTTTLGYLGYSAPILRALRGYAPPRITVEVDDGPAVEGQLVIVSNTRNYGGLFTMADRASCDSGHLDICVLSNGSIWGLVRAGVAGLTGGLSGRDDVAYITGKRVRVRTDEPVPYEVDGDAVGETPLEIQLRPAHVPFVVPVGTV